MADSFVLKSDKYRIIRELGRGGMGVVYLAEDVMLHRIVALKVLYEHLNRDDSFVGRFQKEARSVSSLRHPNVVFVHGLEVVQQTFLIDMEYVEGLSLDKFIRAKAVAPPVVARIASDILEGLVVCHGAGVIHCDIKPANILLDQAGVAKIADFGLATAYAGHLLDSVKGQTTSGIFMGTPRYAPPAAWDGGEPQPGWDLYSLGVILFEMLTGKVAFSGETPMAIMRQHLSTPLGPIRDVVPGVSNELASLVDLLLDATADSSSLTALDALERLQETPEFGQVREGESARTIKAAIRKNWFQRRGKRPRRTVGRHVYLGFTLFLVVIASSWLFMAHPFTRAQSQTPATAQTTIDDSLLFLRPESVEKPGQEQSLWMVTKTSPDGTRRVIALNDSGLWRMDLQPADDSGRFTVSGHWGEYLAPAHGSVRYGTFDGAALLDKRSNSLSLSVVQTNARDHSTRPFHLLALPVETTSDSPAFIRDMESNRIVRSLLYNELIPRNLAWATDIEGLMPGFEGGRIHAPQADTALYMDGVLSEALWVQAPSEEMKDDETPGPRVLARWSPEAVVLGFRADAVAGDAHLDIVLQVGPEVALVEVGWFEVSIGRDGRVGGTYRAGETEVPWECDWEGAMQFNDGQWEAEVRIPLDGMDALTTPEAGRHWRINARLLNPTTEKVLAQWGDDEIEKVKHGSMLIFREEAL